MFHQLWESFVYFFFSLVILITCILDGFIFSHGLLRLCVFGFNLFFSLFRLDNYVSVFRFTDSYFCHLQSAIKTLQWILHFSRIFSLEFSFQKRVSTSPLRFSICLEPRIQRSCDSEYSMTTALISPNWAWWQVLLRKTACLWNEWGILFPNT